MNKEIVIGIVLLTGLFGFSPSPAQAASKETDHPATSAAEHAYRSPLWATLIPALTTSAMAGLGLAIGTDWTKSGLTPDAGFWIFSTGILFGPAGGHFYTGEIGRGLLTSLGRGVSLLVFLAGKMELLSTDCGGDESCYSANDRRNFALKLTGILGAVGFAAWDLVDAPFSAKRFNKRHRSLSLTPVLLPSSSRARGYYLLPGLALTGRF